MRSSQPLQLRSECLEIVHSFYEHIQSEICKLEEIVTLTSCRSVVRVPGQNRSVSRLFMVHVGIILILRVLNVDRQVFVDHGLKVRIYDWIREEPIFCERTVRQARGLVELFHSLVYPGLLNLMIFGDEEDESRERENQLVEMRDDEDRGYLGDVSGADFAGGDEETDDEVVADWVN